AIFSFNVVPIVIFLSQPRYGRQTADPPWRSTACRTVSHSLRTCHRQLEEWLYAQGQRQKQFAKHRHPHHIEALSCSRAWTLSRCPHTASTTVDRSVQAALPALEWRLAPPAGIHRTRLQIR